MENLIRQKEEINSNQYCVSIYTSCAQQTKLEVTQKLKSQILVNLKDGFDNGARMGLISDINLKVSDLDDIPNGIAIFTKLDMLEKTYKNLEVIRLETEPSDDVFIGKTFKVDQLDRSESMSQNAIVLNLEKDICEVYLFGNNKIEKVQTIKNTFTTDRENHREVYSPTRADQTIHGTGSKNLERSIQKKSEYFLTQIREELQNLTTEKSYDHIVVFYSQTFSELIKNFENNLKKQFPNLDVTVIDNNLHNKNKIFESTKETLNSFYIAKNQEALIDSRENYKLHTTGWNSITEASRQQKIDTLFIRLNSKKQGYLLDGKYLYSYPVKDSKQIDNIAPRLVNQTIENGGKVIYINDENLIDENEVEAKLRY